MLFEEGFKFIVMSFKNFILLVNVRKEIELVHVRVLNQIYEYMNFD